MAVARMKRVTMVGAADLRDEALSNLMDLGVVHVEPLRALEESPSDIASRLAAARRALAEITRRAKQQGVSGDARSSIDPDEALRRANEILRRRTELESRRAAVRKEMSQAEPWGEITQADIQLLRAQGVNLEIGQVQPARVKHVAPALASAIWSAMVPLAGGKDVGLAAILAEGETLDIDETPLPSRPLSDIRKDYEVLDSELKALEQDLDRLALEREALVQAEKGVADQLRFAEARLTLGGDEEVFALAGWCPASRVAEVEALVKGRALAVLVDDPDESDQPPVILENSKAVGWFEPLLKMFGVPHYREPDPTAFFAPFMAIFYGFALGDAAYGVLLFGFATWLMRRLKLRKGDAFKAFRLLQVLGVSTVVVGLLTGVVFGVSLYELEAVRKLGVTPQMLLFWINDNPQNFFYAALVMGLLQLSVGIGIRIVRQISLGQVQGTLASIGWLLVVPAFGLFGYALLEPEAGGKYNEPARYIFYVALALIALFKNPSSSVVRRLGGGLWGYYEWVLGVFGDLMSYLRIFGLGLSSGIIAQVVNTIAAMIRDSAPVIGWILAGVLLVVGHGFNFAMSVLGAAVHSARLQFLEFFGKFFEGGGRLYRPFARTKQGGDSP